MPTVARFYKSNKKPKFNLEEFMVVLKEGSKAPAFSIPDQNGKKVALKDFKGNPVILYFYPKDMTPGCTQEACDFKDSMNRLKKKGVTVLGISLDSIERHQKFIKKYDLNFSLLSDEDAKVSKSYGVYKQKNLYGHKFMGIERTTFVIDGQQKITKIFPKVKVAGHVDEILSQF